MKFITILSAILAVCLDRRMVELTKEDLRTIIKEEITPSG